MISLFGWEKGGVGKTNTAVQMAGMLALAAHDIVLVDGDKQGSASDWAAIRNESENLVSVPCSSRQGKAVAHDSILYAKKYEHVVIDAGGRDSAELRFAMAVADIVVMPVRPGAYDAWALDKMVSLKKDVEAKIEKEVRIAMMINACNPATSEDEEVREYLINNYGDVFEMLDTVVYDRVVHRRSAREGRCVVEMSHEYADAKATKELRQLYEEIYGESWKKA